MGKKCHKITILISKPIINRIMAENCLINMSRTMSEGVFTGLEQIIEKKNSPDSDQRGKFARSIGQINELLF